MFADFLKKIGERFDFNQRLQLYFTIGTWLLTLAGILLVFKFNDLVSIYNSQDVVEGEIHYQGSDFVQDGTLASSQKSEDKVIVDISGAVENPGVYKFDTSARLNDVVDAAGGLSAYVLPEFVSKSINLAEKVKDGQKIYIPFRFERDVIPVAEASYALNLFKCLPSSTGVNGDSQSGDLQNTSINMNSADKTELDTLPGIGPSYAEKIMSNRPYENMDDFRVRSGVPGSTIDKFADSVAF